MAEFILEANERKAGPKSQLTEIRKNSRVPGVVYGFSKDPVAMDIDYISLLKILSEAGTSNIIILKVAGKDIKVIVRDYQQDPVTDRLSHVDFMAVDEKRELTTFVPLEFTGSSKAVREQGGKVNVKNEKVKVRCLPQDLPASIKVDLSALADLGEKLLVRDLKVAEKVVILNDPNDPVVDVTVPKKIAITSAEEADATAAAAAEAKPEGESPEGEVKPEAEESK